MSTPKMSTPKNLYWTKRTVLSCYFVTCQTASQTGSLINIKFTLQFVVHGMVLCKTWRKWTILMIARPTLTREDTHDSSMTIIITTTLELTMTHTLTIVT